MKKNERGITLISLAVVIIVIIIIAGVTTYSGVASIQESKEEKLLAEIKIVQHAVLETYTKYKVINQEDYLVGKEITKFEDIPEKYKNFISSTDKVVAFLPTATKEEKYYKLDKESLNSIGITDALYTYIVNYRNGEVMNADLYETAGGTVLYVTLNNDL